MTTQNLFTSDADYEAYLDGSVNYDPMPYRENLRMDDEEPTWEAWEAMQNNVSPAKKSNVYPSGIEEIAF